MIFFAWFGLAGEVEELGAEETDPFTTKLENMLGLVGKLDVPDKLDAFSIRCYGRQVAEFAQRELECLPLLDEPVVFLKPLRIRVEDDDAAVAVEDDARSIGRSGRELTAADNCWNSECTGDDRGVTGSAAKVGRKADHAGAIETRGLRRCEVARQQDRAGGKLRHPAFGASEQVVQQP